MCVYMLAEFWNTAISSSQKCFKHICDVSLNYMNKSMEYAMTLIPM